MIYHLHNSDGYYYIALYVDNLLFASASQREVDRVKAALHYKFSLKDLGEDKFILGNQIQKRPSEELFLPQKAYLLHVIPRFNVLGCKTASIPMEVVCQLQYFDTEIKPEFKRRYLQHIGTLL